MKFFCICPRLNHSLVFAVDADGTFIVPTVNYWKGDPLPPEPVMLDAPIYEGGFDQQKLQTFVEYLEYLRPKYVILPDVPYHPRETVRIAQMVLDSYIYRYQTVFAVLQFRNKVTSAWRYYKRLDVDGIAIPKRYIPFSCLLYTSPSPRDRG